MKSCGQCQQQNQDDANFCYQCGTGLTALAASPTSSAVVFGQAENDLWHDFIGPNANRYLEQFKKFGSAQSPRFALTWNWPAFLYVSFLWFLYRKMYLYAAVYAIGPILSAYLTGDMTSGIVWSVVAGATGNYVYYWHCREHITAIKQQAWNDPAQQQAAIREDGGVQPYVIWVGVVFYLLFSLTMFKMLQEGALDLEKIPNKPAKTTTSLPMLSAVAARQSTLHTRPNLAHTPLHLSPQSPVSVPAECMCAASFFATNS
jgi:hypothetical protein